MSSDNHRVLDYVPDDGYTELGFIKAIPRLHGDLRFEFRPFLAEERSKLLDQMEALKGGKGDVVIAQALVDKLKTWSLADKDGKELPVTLNVARRLKPALFYRLWNILLGTDASDIDPLWDSEQTTSLMEDELEAADIPAPVGVVKEAVAEKNSDSG